MRKADLKPLSKPYLSHLPKPSGIATPSSRSSSIPVSLELFGGATVLSIHPSRSILSAKALAALKYAFLQNKKVGISSSTESLKPKDEDLEKAVAAYEIAQDLVTWSEQIEVVPDEETPLECEGGQMNFDVQKLDSEDDHRSQELKDDQRSQELKDDQRSQELKDKSFARDAKDTSPFPEEDYLSPIDAKNESLLETLFSDDCRSGATDGKTLVTGLLDCEGMDFFAASTSEDQDDDCRPTLSQLVESSIFPDVDIDFAFGVPPLPRDDSHAPDDDSLELDLLSPISSPNSPSTFSPNSPGLYPP